jgi:hypothetical protein
MSGELHTEEGRNRHVAERRAETEREVGVDTRHAGLISPAALLEDLVRVLARSAASEAHEASQTSKDEDSHEQ